MRTPTVDQRAHRRATAVLLAIVVVALALLTLAVVIVLGHRSEPTRGSSQPHAVTSVPASTQEDSNTGAEDSLAQQPMLTLPPQAAQPHQLTDQSAGPSITLPQPVSTVGHWMPDSLPATPAGALAQLKILDEKALAGGDPAVYASAYRQASLPGAPDPSTTGLMILLTSFRAHAGLPNTGVAAGVTVAFNASEGLIKGVVDGGHYAVVCVLGELTVQTLSQTSSIGVGDCQALRWTGLSWRISPGALAAAGPCAWPGSVESVTAGYRELS